MRPEHLKEVIRTLERAGAVFDISETAVTVSMAGRPLPLQVETGPYPGFPTDLQSPVMGLLCCASGVSRIRETVFEGRYETAAELEKLGASVTVREGEALVRGRPVLRGGRAGARDLRGGAALVVAGLAAEGETEIYDCFHIERGYEDICRDLRLAGADIRWQRQEAKEKEN